MTPDVIPASSFAHKHWWRPVRQGLDWYYHTHRQLAHPSLYVDTDTLDEDLAHLVGALHREGVPTWPSCAGHWWMRDVTMPMYRQLVSDMHQVRGSGMWLQHTETGETIRFQQPNYLLPWRSNGEFHHAVASGNGEGYLAFCPPEDHGLWLWRPEQAHVFLTHEKIAGYPSIVVRVEAPGPEPQRAAWRNLLFS